jgi:hypothetical protein
MICSVLIDEEFAILYDDSFFGFEGIITAFSDDVLDFMGVLQGDWRREFDERFDNGYDECFLLFRELYKEFGLGMVLN